MDKLPFMIIERARDFAFHWHTAIGHKRKYTEEPYIHHLENVAQNVIKVGGTHQMVAAAYLHDLLEDVFPICNGVNVEALIEKFGAEIAQMVVDLTDVYTKEAYPDLSRKERKRLENERVAKLSPDVKTIKLADLADNVPNVVQHCERFAKVFLAEALELLPCLMEGNSDLLNTVSCYVIDGCNKLNVPIITISHEPTPVCQDTGLSRID